MNKCLLIVGLFFNVCSYAQKQVVRGILTDQVSRLPVNGVTVSKGDSTLLIVSDSLGNFVINDIPVGRVALTFNSPGYEPFYTEEFLLGSVKEVYLEIVLKRKGLQLKEVKVTAKHPSNPEPVNQTAFVSARSFSAEETERIPAAFNDPARMALSFPGVQGGRNDEENHLVIRGNSPMGLLWRVEGVDIPSPNHFTKHGTAAGGLTIFSTSLIDRSDFFTGGMPAEYGNALSGAFDIRLRKGNDQKYAQSFKIGLLGIDLSSEGPIQKGRSSYLINYRYSTFGLVNLMKLYLSGERTFKTFQDLSFNFVFYSKNHKARTNIYGVGGFSTEHEYPVKNPKDRNPGIQDEWEELDRDNEVGITGLSHERSLNSHSSLKIGLALVGSNIKIVQDTLGEVNQRFRFNNEIYEDKRIVGSVHYSNQLNARTFLKTGLIVNYLDFRFLKEYFPRFLMNNPSKTEAERRLFADGTGTTHYTQLYAQVVRNFGPNLKINAGFHVLQFGLNKETSFEPRLSAKYKLSDQQDLSFAFGLYSQLLPMSTYFVTNKLMVDGRISYFYPNENLNFPRTRHFVLGYTYRTGNRWRLVAETYYQKINRVSVQPVLNSNFWFLNYASGYPDVKVTAEGEGENYGLDVAIEKGFSRNYYLLLNASLFDASYSTLDKQKYKSGFSDGYNAALTAGKEIKFSVRKTLHIGARVLYNGGFRYSPPDVAQSMAMRFYFPIISQTNALQSPYYFRVDSRISYRVNMKKFTSVVSLDVQNVSNRQNYSKAVFDFVKKEVVLQRRSGGIIPLASIQFEF